MKIMYWQIIMIVLFFGIVYLLYRVLSKWFNKPKVLILYLVASASTFSSCETQDYSLLESNDTISNKETLDKYVLEKLGSNFTIKEESPNDSISTNNSDLVFKTKEELDAFLEGIKTYTIESTELRLPDETSKTGWVVESNYICGSICTYVNVGFNISQSCQGTGLTSWMSGFTLGVSYDHVGGMLYNRSNSVCYKSAGVINYNIFFEGIGTIFSQYIEFEGCISCN